MQQIGDAYALPFSVMCNVYMPNSEPGDATTPNSFGRAFIYRPSIPNESGATILYPNTNFTYVPADGVYPACYVKDMGTAFATPRVRGQSVLGIVEVVHGVNGYTGVDYCGAVLKDITDLSGIDLDKVNIQPLPHPQESEKGAHSVTIKWTGVSTKDAGGNPINYADTYAVYRSTEQAGTYTFLGTVPHASGEITYTDTTCGPGTTYFYKLRMRYSWPANTPPYYETTAESSPSAAISIPLVCYVNNARVGDTGDGLSWGTAKKTIQAAIDAAQAAGGGEVWEIGRAHV